MSIITGRGKSLKEQLKNQKKRSEDSGEKLDYKKIKINKDLKKEGDSIKVRILSDEDFTTYEGHQHFGKNILPAPCLNPTGEGEDRCLFCEASKEKDWEDLKAQTKFLFAFYDLELEMVRYIGVTYTQGLSLMSDIEEYEEDLDDYGFTLKRTGEGTKTSYKLSPILKLKGAEKESFEKADGLTVPDDFFEKAIYVKYTNQQAIDLENKGFDVEGILGYEIKDDSQPEGEGEKKQDGEGEDPTKVF